MGRRGTIGGSLFGAGATLAIAMAACGGPTPEETGVDESAFTPAPGPVRPPVALALCPMPALKPSCLGAVKGYLVSAPANGCPVVRVAALGLEWYPDTDSSAWFYSTPALLGDVCSYTFDGLVGVDGVPVTVEDAPRVLPASSLCPAIAWTASGAYVIPDLDGGAGSPPPACAVARRLRAGLLCPPSDPACEASCDDGGTSKHGGCDTCLQ